MEILDWIFATIFATSDFNRHDLLANQAKVEIEPADAIVFRIDKLISYGSICEFASNKDAQNSERERDCILKEQLWYCMEGT